MTAIIDRQAVAEQFEDLDEETSEALLSAVENDLRNWVESLKVAVVAKDREAMSRARHSLKGLCGSFGAQALGELAERDSADQQTVVQLSDCLEETVSAIVELVRGQHQ